MYSISHLDHIVGGIVLERPKFFANRKIGFKMFRLQRVIKLSRRFTGAIELAGIPLSASSFTAAKGAMMHSIASR